MIKTKLFIGIACFFMLLNACTNAKKENNKPTQKDENVVEFIFLQLNDVYEIAALEGGKVGGLDRVEMLYKKLKKENKNTFNVFGRRLLKPIYFRNDKIPRQKT